MSSEKKQTKEPLKGSKTLWLVRLQSLIALLSAAFSALPETQQLLWLKQLLPTPFVILIMLGFALAMAWRRLAEQMEREGQAEQDNEKKDPP